MPQVGQRGLVKDAKAAYLFARRWGTKEGEERHVIVGGASGGMHLPPPLSSTVPRYHHSLTHSFTHSLIHSFTHSLTLPGFFVASLIAHHAHPPPSALFSISGIATFRHPFFNSSTLNYAPGFDDVDMDQFISMPLWLGQTPTNSPTLFELARLLPNGLKNPGYVQREEVVRAKPHRGTLYEYYTYKNAWLDLVGEVDLGYEWARQPEEGAARAEAWPKTVVFHGDYDSDVPLGVSRLMEEALGVDKVKIVVARGMGHLFELMWYLEEDAPGMEAVREAMGCLDEVVMAK